MRFEVGDIITAKTAARPDLTYLILEVNVGEEHKQLLLCRFNPPYKHSRPFLVVPEAVQLIRKGTLFERLIYGISE